MPPGSSVFAADYPSARSSFRQAVAARGGRLDAIPIDARGPHGDVLTIDIGWLGPPDATRAVIHSSGLHGVEGFTGSAIQSAWLAAAAEPLPAGTALVLIHALNPFGMAWLRRFNENNVDLNRNVLPPADQYGGAPDNYGAVDGVLNPESPPAADWFLARLAWLVVRHGRRAVADAIAAGQYVNRRGICFGGAGLEQGPRAMFDYLRSRLGAVERLVAVDVHTGLGRSGDGALFVDGSRLPPDDLRALREAFGPELTDVAARGEYRVRGAYASIYSLALPTAKVHALTQEIGTYSPAAMLTALRDENRWHHYGDGTMAHPSKARLKERFNPDADGWRQTALARGTDALARALLCVFD